MPVGLARLEPPAFHLVLPLAGAQPGCGGLGTTNPLPTSTAAAINVNGGTLLWNNDHQVANNVAVTLNGGRLDLNGYTESLGVLTLTVSSVIDLGPGGDLTFAGTGVLDPGAILSIWNYDGAIYTGAGATGNFFISGLTGQQLSQLQFFSGAGVGPIGVGGGVILPNSIVPVPEPSAMLSFGFLLCLIRCQEHRFFVRVRAKTQVSN